MQPWKILTKLLLITILALSASGVVSAKVASGPQNLGPGLHQGETAFNPLTHLAKIDVSTTLTPGSPVVTKKGTLPESVFSSKAPKQTTPGTKTLEGQHINDKGRVEPWKAHYDEHGRQIGRTDYNAGNKAQGIPGTHHHTYEYGPGKNGMETGSHLPGEYKPR